MCPTSRLGRRSQNPFLEATCNSVKRQDLAHMPPPAIMAQGHANRSGVRFMAQGHANRSAVRFFMYVEPALDHGSWFKKCDAFHAIRASSNNDNLAEVGTGRAERARTSSWRYVLSLPTAQLSLARADLFLALVCLFVCA